MVFIPLPTLRNDPLDPALLQAPHLLPKGLDLAPAVEGAAVVLAQAADDIGAGGLDGGGDVADDSARLEPAAEGLNLAGDLLAGGRVVIGGGVRGGIRVGGGVKEGPRELLGKAGARVGLELAQLGGHAGLDLGLGELGAGGVGLWGVRRGKEGKGISK